MRRTALTVIVAVLALGMVGTPRGWNTASASRVGAPASKKVCHYVTRKVHGKKKRVKVCHTVKKTPTPVPTATSVPDEELCGTGSAPTASFMADRRSAMSIRPRQASSGAEAEHPGDKNAVIFAPFFYDFGAEYQPAVDALQNEGYNVTVYKRGGRIGGGTNDSPEFTINDFAAASGKTGVLIIDTHGGGTDLAMEAYESRAARDAAYAARLKQGWSPAEIIKAQINAHSGTGTPETVSAYTIDITNVGFKDHWKSDNSLIYVSACDSWDVAAGFPNAGYFVGYTASVEPDQSSADFKSFWAGMDGTSDAGGNLDDPNTRLTTRALAGCRQSDSCQNMSQSGSPLVLAPSLVDRQPSPKEKLIVNGPSFHIHVAFNTDMDQSQTPTSVVSYSGCDLKQVNPLQWQDDHTIDGEFKAMSDGKLTITVSAASAVANSTDVQLDGNQTGTQPNGDGDPQASVRPNGDDFQWKVPCQEGFAFSGLTVKVNVNGNQATKTYVLSGHTCSLQLDSDQSKITGASWALNYTYTISGYGGPDHSRTAKVMMSIPDKTVNQNGQPVPLVPDSVLIDPIGMQIALSGLYNSDPAQLFSKSQVGGSAGVYVIQQPTQLIDMDSSKDTTDCPRE